MEDRSRQRGHHEAQKLNLSIEKSRKFGVKPLLSLEQTIEKTVSWYQNVLVHGQSL